MADNVVKLRVDSNEYEGKIRRASEGIQALGRSLRDAGRTFADADEKQTEFVRELGRMQTVSNTAKGKIGEMSAAFINLKSQYLQMSDAERQSPIGQAMSRSLEQLKSRTIDAKRELESLNRELNETKMPDIDGKVGGGLFSGLGDKMGGALQVFAGNMLTKAAGAVASLGSEMVDMIQQGIEMAKAGEGIRIAFERLGRGDILDGLREATHGTVTDLELMKAAVKFNDFKLPVEELGTMLAFAQQKAKDTGQSVDYMVDSIVTGLGRKSLMILDNLGLSATEVKERMKETGDMTKAVGAIIREQMSKAGDYVETAADRAAQANVNLQNKMEELGRKFAPVEEASNQLWTSMKISILDIVGGPLARLLNGLTEAGRLKNALNDINGDGGETRSSRRLRILREYSGSQTGVTKQTVYNRQIARYAAEEEKEWRKVNELTRQRQAILKELGNINPREDEKGVQANFLNAQANSLLSQINDAKNHVKAIQLSRQEYEKGAKQLLNPSTSLSSSNLTTITPSGGGKGGNTKAEVEAVSGSIDEQTKKVQELQKAWRAAADDNSRQKIKAEIEEQQYLLDRMTGKEKFDPANMRELTDLRGTTAWAPSSLFTAGTAPVAPSEIKFSESLQKFMDYMEKQQVDDYKKRQSHDGWDDTKKVVSGLNQVAGGLQQMGIKLPEEVQQIIGVINGLMTVIDGVNTIIGVTQSANLTANTIALGALTQAIWTNTAFSFFPGMAHGGVVRAAVGYEVPGNHFSGDMVPALLNSGETVLNRAQSGIIASALEGVGMGNMSFELKAAGEELIAVIDRTGKRKGKGELCWWKN